MIASDPPANPVLRELAALQNDIDVDPDPEQTQFEYCRTRARSTQNRCRRSISKKDAFSSKEDQINSLLASFNNLMECPKDATFYDNIEEFLVTTHCRQHYDRYLSPRFLEWKERRSREPSILSNEDGATNNNGTTKSISEPDSKPPSINLDKESRPGEALEKVPLASRVENVIEDVPEMRIATNNQHENSGVDDIRIDEEIHNIMGLGLANLKRSGSLRDGSPIIREIYEPITLEQSAQGTVHVLEHQEIQGLFKIGWTGGDTSSSLHQAYNCYGTATKMIHETSEGPFYGAYKAQRLAQVFLRHHNLSVARCEKCGQEHGEWFKTSEERICDTVKLMESFVRLPGYTLQDGLMKVSPRADRIVKAMCSVSPETLAGCMAKEEGPTEADIGANEMSDVVTTTTVTKTTVVTESSYNIVNKVHPRSHSSSLVGPDQANKGLGHHKKGFWGVLVEMARRRRARHSISREPASEQEKVDGIRMKKQIEAPGTNRELGAEDMTVGLLWNLIPENIKTGADSAREDRPHNFSSLKRSTSKAIRLLLDESGPANHGRGQK